MANTAIKKVLNAAHSGALTVYFMIGLVAVALAARVVDRVMAL